MCQAEFRQPLPYVFITFAVVEGWPMLLDDTHPYRLFSGFYGQGNRRTDVCVCARIEFHSLFKA